MDPQTSGYSNLQIKKLSFSSHRLGSSHENSYFSLKHQVLCSCDTHKILQSKHVYFSKYIFEKTSFYYEKYVLNPYIYGNVLCKHFKSGT